MGNTVEKFCFFPPDPPESLVVGHFPGKVRTIDTKNGHQIPIYHIMNPKSKYAIIFSHGNGSDLGQMIPLLAYFGQKLDASIVGYEYLGYGHSKIKSLGSDTSEVSSSCSTAKPFPSEAGCYESLRAAMDYVSTNCPDQKIILMGQSIGSGPTVHYGHDPMVSGVILVSPILSAVKVKFRTNVFNIMDVFQNDSKIHRIKVPVYIVHGMKDQLVEFHHGKILYELHTKNNQDSPKIPFKPLWLPTRDHNDIWSHDLETVTKGMNHFLRHLSK